MAFRDDDDQADVGPDRELAALLAVDPSPELSARVRVGIARHAEARGRWPLPLAAGSAIVLTAMLLLVAFRADRPASTSRVIAHRTIATDIAAMPRPLLTRRLELSGVTAARSQGLDVRAARVTEHVQPTATVDSKVLVSPDEALGITVLLAQEREKRASLLGGAREISGPESIEAIAIPPITIDLLDPARMVDVEGVLQ